MTSKAIKHVLKDIENLNKTKGILCLYLKDKQLTGDWHAVADAAMDIREIEYGIKALEYSLGIANTKGLFNKKRKKK